jgi:hypothetical protein
VLGEVVEGVGSMDERFARYAASNKARSTGSLAFNDDGFQAELG